MCLLNIGVWHSKRRVAPKGPWIAHLDCLGTTVGKVVVDQVVSALLHLPTYNWEGGSLGQILKMVFHSWNHNLLYCTYQPAQDQYEYFWILLPFNTCIELSSWAITFKINIIAIITIITNITIITIIILIRRRRLGHQHPSLQNAELSKALGSYGCKVTIMIMMMMFIVGLIFAIWESEFIVTTLHVINKLTS